MEQVTLSYEVGNKNESLSSMKKLVAVSISMILQKRFGMDPSNFIYIKYGENTYPLLQKTTQDLMADHIRRDYKN